MSRAALAQCCRSRCLLAATACWVCAAAAASPDGFLAPRGSTEVAPAAREPPAGGNASGARPANSSRLGEAAAPANASAFAAGNASTPARTAGPSQAAAPTNTSAFAAAKASTPARTAGSTQAAAPANTSAFAAGNASTSAHTARPSQAAAPVNASAFAADNSSTSMHTAGSAQAAAPANTTALAADNSSTAAQSAGSIQAAPANVSSGTAGNSSTPANITTSGEVPANVSSSASGTSASSANATGASQAATYRPFNPELLKPSSADVHTFYMYRAMSDEVYPPMNVNAASLGGVLWYLHHEVVIQYPRKFGITKIVRMKVQTKATEPIWRLGMNFGARWTYDKGQSTGPFVCGRDSPNQSPHPKFCNGAFNQAYAANVSSLAGQPFGGPYEWEQFGFVVGCNKLGDFPFPMFPVYYPDAIWYSLPGPCPSLTFDEMTKTCAAQEPGGMCEGTPTGTGSCTWSYEMAGEITLDELVGKPVAELDAAGGREYDPLTDKGYHFSWWDGINMTAQNERRVNATRALFAAKHPNMTADEELMPPPCDFDFGKFYKQFFWKDPLSGPCHNELPGSACSEGIAWSMQEGIYAHPEWYPGLTNQSTVADFQRLFYMQGKPGCTRRPCGPGEQEPPAAAAAPVPAGKGAAPSNAGGKAGGGPAQPAR